ncbi:MAG: polyketide synthase, partial [Phycisphaerales bacterium]|nr:polyketide synthase [Phycisphaerales bacterium]
MLSREPIAIVGIGGVFPGAPTPTALWRNILAGRDTCAETAADRWIAPASALLNPTLAPDSVYSTRACLCEALEIPTDSYDLDPRLVQSLDPVFHFALEAGNQAWRDAGATSTDKTRCGVALAAIALPTDGASRLTRLTRAASNELDLFPNGANAQEPTTREWLNAYAVGGPAALLAASLGIGGGAFTLDAACASSLLAVEQAIDQLRNGTSDVALAGAIQLSTPGPVYSGFSLIGALSPSGTLAPFSEGSDGTLLGQGAGMIVLKRLGDAERDGNRIYALIKDVGTSSDGKGAGLLAPLSRGQAKAIRRAYEKSGVDPDTIELVEAHATGIPLGDATELQSLDTCLPDHAGAPRVAIGSCKSNIGHMIPASGMASIMKTAFALYHRVLPPQGTSAPPREKLGLERTRFYLNTELRPWVHGTAAPRRAAIDSFGFGGINAHGILEEYLPPSGSESDLERFHRTWPVELVVLSAPDRASLAASVAALSSWIDALPADAELELLDVAAACARVDGASRVAIVAKDLAELRRKLDVVTKRLAEADRDRIQDRSGVFWYAEPLAATSKVALVFP